MFVNLVVVFNICHFVLILYCLSVLDKYQLPPGAIHRYCSPLICNQIMLGLKCPDA